MSQTKIYVGNLSYNTTDHELEEFFGQYGSIKEIKLITDRETGRSKGFGFITFDDQQAAQASLQANGLELQSRKLRVNMANDDARRTSGAGGGRGGRQGGGGSREGWR